MCSNSFCKIIKWNHKQGVLVYIISNSKHSSSVSITSQLKTDHLLLLPSDHVSKHPESTVDNNHTMTTYFAMRYYQMKELTSWHGGGQIWLFIIEQIANRGSLYMNILIAKYSFILNSINHAHYLTFTGIILMHEIKQNKSMALQNKHNF